MSNSLHDSVVKKPWGFEWTLYENEPVGVWRLHIDAGASTSLHSHPLKKTGLIVLAGTAEVSFMNGSHILGPGDKIMIRNNVFHSTRAVGGDLELIECETPNNKLDLVRLEDAYGRSGTPYEGAQFYTPIVEKIDLLSGERIGDCRVQQVQLEQPEDFIGRAPAKIVFLAGTITYLEHAIVGPGDVVDTHTLTRLASKFTPGVVTALEVTHTPIRA